ncbi:MAG: gamma-glutamylcyclotransferase [Candidatus Riflebacteria bacterium HGW-Riflebacteria-1]|jgi:gamma-glutamylcyclotransferase (GGCT)/AIG2-like uncharacterized protein YtfP|nr:MAG: gamma-glutamylcyclotransferase [Candidatus Riflebacteria bacterium HGW-Riflebacteria-1]
MIKYFAYGSNMSLEQMKKRCPQHKVVGQGTLHGYRWIINSRGYANIIQSESDYVIGVVYEISASDEACLDRKEGVAKGCYNKETLDISTGDAQITCIVYIDPIVTEGAPKEEYIGRIEDGIRDAKLPPDYVARYLRRFLNKQ